MSGDPVLLVHPHAAGPWIVQRGRRRLVVPAALGRALAAWHGKRPRRDDVRAALPPGLSGQAAVDLDRFVAALWRRPARRRRGPWVRGEVLPPALTRRLARPLVPLVSVGALVLLAMAGAVALGAQVLIGDPPPPLTWTRAALALPLFLATALLHELGHAAALLRRGYAPGAVGVGVLFFLPVLWCDVSPVALLPPRRRLAVDLAGPALQLAAAGTLFATDILLPASRRGPWALAGAAAAAAVVWSLIPFIRSDGFWALGDALGIGDLDRAPEPWEPRRTRWTLRTYGFLHTLFLAAVGFALAHRLLDALAGPLALGPGLRGGLGWGIGALAAGLAAWRLVRRAA